MKPYIYRTWAPRLGRFVWMVNALPNNWGRGASNQAKFDWQQAWNWCLRQNAKELL